MTADQKQQLKSMFLSGAVAALNATLKGEKLDTEAAFRDEFNRMMDKGYLV
jgi:hypothetical protein